MVVNPTRTKNFLYKKKYPAALLRGFFIGRSNEWTSSALIRLGWHWPLTSEYYLDKLILNLRDIGYFVP
jgi:hypothetical protein